MLDSLLEGFELSESSGQSHLFVERTGPNQVKHQHTRLGGDFTIKYIFLPKAQGQISWKCVVLKGDPKIIHHASLGLPLLPKKIL